jgi:hypothetical protein
MSKTECTSGLSINSVPITGDTPDVPGRCPLFKAQLYELAEAELAGEPLTEEQTELKPHAETCPVCSVVYHGAIAFAAIPLPDKSDNALTQLRQGFEDNPLRRLKQAAAQTPYFQSPQRNDSFADYVRGLAAEIPMSDGDALTALGFTDIDGLGLSVLNQLDEDTAHAARLLGFTLDDFPSVAKGGSTIFVRAELAFFFEERAYASSDKSGFQEIQAEQPTNWTALARACKAVGISRAEASLCLQFQRLSDCLNLPRLPHAATAPRLDVHAATGDSLLASVEELRKMAQAKGIGIDLTECEEALNSVFGSR